MRIIATSDLHHDIARSKGPAEQLAADICAAGGDVLILVGDSACGEPASMDRVLGLFNQFRGDKLAVAGNHELWTYGGACSLVRYENELAEACSRNGFHYLDAAPYVRDGVAVVGSVGWYDYSFLPKSMGIPRRFYEHKIAPGAAARYDELRHLFEPADDIAMSAHDVTTRWMDGVRVRLSQTDAAFTQRLANRLARDIEAVQEKATHVVAAIHTLPFFELVPHSILPNLEFATAFLGSDLLGSVLTDHPRVTHAFCGHSHRHRVHTVDGLTCTAIGSTYKEKRYEVLDLL